MKPGWGDADGLVYAARLEAVRNTRQSTTGTCGNCGEGKMGIRNRASMLGAKAMCEKFCSRVVCDPLVEQQWLSCTTLPLRSYFKTQLCPYSTKSLLSYNSRSQGHPSPLKLCCLYHLCYLIWCLKLVSCISKKKLKNTKPSGEWCREETG